MQVIRPKQRVVGRMVGDRVGVRPAAAMEGDNSPGVVMEEEEEVMALRITTDKRGAGDMVTEGA